MIPTGRFEGSINAAAFPLSEAAKLQISGEICRHIKYAVRIFHSNFFARGFRCREFCPLRSLTNNAVKHTKLGFATIELSFKHLIPYSIHGRRSRGGTRGQPPVEFELVGAIMQIVPLPLRFCHIGIKGAFSGLQNTPKSVFGRDVPRTLLRQLTTLPRPSSRLGRDTPSHTPPHSAPTHLWRSPCVPRISARSRPVLQPRNIK